MTQTKGNIIVENLKVGDIIYEYEYGFGIKSEVITKPELNKDGAWEWRTKNLVSGGEINYLVDSKSTAYAPNIYDHEAYNIQKYI